MARTSWSARNHAAADHERAVGDEGGFAAVERDVLPKRAVQNPVVFVRKVERVAKDRVGIRQAQGRFEAEASCVARVFRRICVADEQLRWNASSMGTGASEGAALDEGDVHSGGTAVDGG